MSNRVQSLARGGFEGAMQHKNDRRLPYAQHRLDFPGKSAVFHGKTPANIYRAIELSLPVPR